MTENTHSIHIDDEVYTLLKAVQSKQKEKISLRQLLQRYVRQGIERELELSNFDTALATYFDNSDNSEGFREYLNSSVGGALIRLLATTQPTYDDISLMSATLVFWRVKPREFFKTLLIYGRYGLSELRNE